MGDMALEPFAGIAFVKVDTDSFKEHGEVAALRSGGFDEDVSYSTLEVFRRGNVNRPVSEARSR